MSRTGYKVANDRNRYEVLALETERLRLSVLRKSEASRVNAYFVKNRDFHKKYSQTHTEDYFTVSMQRKYLAYDYNSFLDGTLVPLWITLKETGEIIGRVSFFNFAFGGMMSCACGYHLDKDHTGKGYMTEALKGAMAFVFDEYKLHRIEAFIVPDNEPSLNLVKRCGFHYEGRRISYMHINGRYRDHDAFYILEDDVK
ncbi:ribosomal-protein-alanine N-acetyltransferase [Ruminococcaceae bacterium R-25]|jgi:ribosomal-protein-alanine N-acetyltransferase|nr:ribosomal-protein-alanine N-acetyltransferase [Ruminococcaceae bacterium R-25]SUQ11484.1 ribosomal-protein-alanine N-acetyltransferase [Oscillospiraceae bacterium]